MDQNNISMTPVWQALKKHFKKMAAITLNTLFKQDAQRFDHFSINTCGLLLDYSKNHINSATVDLLITLAHEAKLQKHIESLMQGGPVNFTEGCKAAHIECRQKTPPPHVKKSMAHMQDIYHALHHQTWLGFTKQPITDVVNLGIGGSDLGPKMVTRALAPYHQKIRCHFVSNIDATALIETLKPLNPATTLFIISSKSFNTRETIMNAEDARAWLLAKGAPMASLSSHFIAITAFPEKALAFGIAANAILQIDKSLGGRYSLWSSIGLPIMIATSPTHFHELLEGARMMDEHFATMPFHRNMPVIMALIGIAYINFFNAETQAIIAYDEYLQYFTSYLQQLDMESNGKSVNRLGKLLPYMTGPVIWGELGCNGQHAFHQLLHQGTRLIPADFIIPIHSHHTLGDHHPILLANALAQTQALMRGKTQEEAYAECLGASLSHDEATRLAPHQALVGNRPTNTLLIDKITPRHLGSLIALYEHKVFTQSVIWGINPFDQWGVELGKSLAAILLPAIASGEKIAPQDSSTDGLIKHCMQHHT